MTETVRTNNIPIYVQQRNGQLDSPSLFPLNAASSVSSFGHPKCIRRGSLRLFKAALLPLSSEEQIIASLSSACESLNLNEIASLTIAEMAGAASVFDSYFQVARAPSPSFDIFAISLVAGYKNLHEDAACGNSLLPLEWGLLRAAFAEIADLLDDSTPEVARIRTNGLRPSEMTAQSAPNVTPLTRWKIGHHVFLS